MPTTSGRTPIEPLVASNTQLWLGVWGVTQGTALAVASWVMIGAAGGVREFLRLPWAPGAVALVLVLVAYHAFGLSAYEWIIRRRWAVAIFVPLRWVATLAAVRLGGTFGVLTLGVIIQAFIFLPFAWAIAALALGIALPVAAILSQAGTQGLSLTIARAAGILAVGIMMGTVMLYIHRVNRDAAIRERLLRQLDEAQRDLAARAKEAGVQEERQRLALDIHDTLAQGFASVIRHLEAVELSSGGRLQDAAPHLAHAQAVSRSSLAEIRRLVWALQPPQLAEASLGAAIDRIVAHWSEVNGIPATSDVGDLPPLLPDADVVFLRATQEALSNVARHAKAMRVGVTLHEVDGLALLTIEDDGRGMANADCARAGAVGISGMRERVRRFRGHVMIDSRTGAGTSITVAMPLATIASVPG